MKRSLNLKLVIVSEFGKGYTQNWLEEVFVINKIKNTIPWTQAISDLNGLPNAGSFYEKELQKPCQGKLRTGAIITRNGDKLYVKWKGYNNSFNSWIKKKTLHKNESIIS